ncbi:MAG TPA: pseudouridine synthase [Chryseolinea sp.]|nr:pseudouridine synthase [Chryseolinea sp.]
MPKHNSSDRPKGRRSSSTGSSSRGKTFNKGSRGDSPSKSENSASSKRPYKKPEGDRPFRRRDDSSAGYSARPSGAGRASSSENEHKRPFRGRDGDAGKDSSRSYSKGPRNDGPDKPFRGRSDGDQRERPNAYPKRPHDRRDGDEKSFHSRERGTGARRGGSSADSFSKRPAPGAGDQGKPFRSRERDGNDSRDRSSSGSFSKRPTRDRSDNERPFRGRDESKRGAAAGSSPRPTRDGDNASRPFRSRGGEDKRGGNADTRPPRKAGSGDDRPFRNRTERSGDRPAPTGGTYSKRPRKTADGDAPPRPREGSAPGKFDLGGVSRSGKSIKGGKEEPVPQQGTIRLNKYIANSGVCSRREADNLISMGLISVNGKVITTLGYKVNPGDEVRNESTVLRAEKPVYILMNKPKGFLTTTADPQERNTVMSLVAGTVKERIYPVGRLDRNTTGLLLLTNDGDLADKLMHPSYNVKKIYKVELDRPLTKGDATRITEGITLEEGRAMVDDLAIISEDRKTIGLEIHIGWNRVVRRIFESMEYQVVKLDRSYYAGLTKKDLGRGEWRFLKKEELVLLKHYK